MPKVKIPPNFASPLFLRMAHKHIANTGIYLQR